MLEWVNDKMSYPGIVLLMFLENVFPPLPSEVIMPLAGYTASRGELSLTGVVIAGTIGSILGQLPLYFLGRLVGGERLKVWADRWGAWLALSGEDIQKAIDWFDRHGHKAVLFGRLVPAIRSLISIPAGISHMNLAKFLLYSTLGTAVWVSVLGYLGRLLGRNYETVGAYLGPATYSVLGLILLGTIVAVVRRKRARA